MVLAGLPHADAAVERLASVLRLHGGYRLAERLEYAIAVGVRVLALTVEERHLILAALEDPPDELA